MHCSSVPRNFCYLMWLLGPLATLADDWWMFVKSMISLNKLKQLATWSEL